MILQDPESSPRDYSPTLTSYARRFKLAAILKNPPDETTISEKALPKRRQYIDSRVQLMDQKCLSL
jgi:hypothetical protein